MMDWRYIKQLIKYEGRVVIAEEGSSPLVVLTMSEYERLLRAGSQRGFITPSMGAMNKAAREDFNDVLAVSLEAERMRGQNEEINARYAPRTANNSVNLSQNSEQIRLEDLPL